MTPVTRRYASLGIAGIVLLCAILSLPARASEQQAGQAIADTAMGYVDSYQGECWPWVRRVVQQATGRTIGFDYRLGFGEAGASEVPVSEAVAGDIIQIANDADSGPNADYPGLHTAIVLKNHGGGQFTVIDSNSQWDGMVRIRTGYDPAAMAARYSGLTARAYRFDGLAAALPAATAPRTGASAPMPVRTGDTVKVAAGGDCLNLRTAAGVRGDIITCLADGTRLKVNSEPLVSGDLSWVEVTTADGRSGWVASLYLSVVPTDAGAPATTGGALAPLMPFRSVVPIIASNP